LLPKIRNKCFLTPELAPVFAARDEDLLQLLGIMTRVLDGYGYENDSGAQGHRGYNERMMFTWIGAAVDIPFKVHRLMTTLGPRLYFLRIPSTQNKSEEDYLSQLEHSDFDVRRDMIQVALMDYLNWLECACPMMEHDDKFNSELKKMPWLNGQATANDYNKIQTQRKALGQIIKLAKLLAPLRGVVPTWHTYNTQGSDYGYTLPTIEEPDRAMQQLVNLARGHAMLTGRNYITSEEDLPMIVKVVLSTAPIERVTIFDILLANHGVLNVNQITQSLRVSEHTAQRTMLELDILGLVDKADDVLMICSDGVTRNGSQITLKEEFQWFLSEEFTSLRQGFKPTKGEGEGEEQQEEAREEKSPRHTDPILDHIEEANTDISTEQSTSQSENDPLCGGEISSTASPVDSSEIVIPDTIYRAYGNTWMCRNCKIKGDKWFMVKHPEHCSTSRRKLREQIACSAGQSTLSFGEDVVSNNINLVSPPPSFPAPAYPFMKWAGGKRQLLPQLSDLAPAKFERYFEPFIGGGALFFYLMSHKKMSSAAYISDINPELINAYTAIRDHCEALINLLVQHKIEYDKAPKDHFYKLRDDYNNNVLNRCSENVIQRAAQLIALNKTAFNGLFRVNSKGEFNTPWGKYENPTICDSTNLQNISNILRNPKVTITVCDYKQMLLENAKAGDFIYLDPPYHPESQTADFTSYTPDKFTENDQKRLAEVFKQLHEINCKVMLTNSNTPLIRDLYCDFAKFTIQAESKRSINCKGSKRKTEGHTDRIIRNYN
jgi:DNA adenine methylase